MRGRLIFEGFLAHDTADTIADAMRSVLDDQLYTFVTANELFGFRPEVRVNLSLREPIEVVKYTDSLDGLIGVRFNDADYACSISTSMLTQQAARELPDQSIDWVFVTITTSGVQIRHRVPAGGRLWWTLTPTGPIPAEVDHG